MSGTLEPVLGSSGLSLTLGSGQVNDPDTISVTTPVLMKGSRPECVG